jgi:tetratricopeptide (TPR) repeat protein
MDVTTLRSLGFCSALVFSAGALSPAVHAQAVDESALEALDQKTPAVVPNIVEPAGAVELRDAMRRISFNPSDADALADAGNAALLLGDANAALNFFMRANAIRPNNSRVVAGLATATVRTENPFEALRLFDDAVRLGASERSIAADRARILSTTAQGGTLLEVTLHSGRNRIVRRMLDAVGHPVIELVRRQFGPLHLGTLASGQMRDLTKVELGQILTLMRADESGADSASSSGSAGAEWDEAERESENGGS